MRALRIAAAALLVLAAACGSTSDGGATPDGGEGGVVPPPGTDGGPPVCAADEGLCHGACAKIQTDDTACGVGSCATSCVGGEHCVAGACKRSAIEHVILIVQENHTFDSYFGKYCQATAGSNPTCTTGPACCEGAPASEPGSSKASAIVLDDSSNFSTDRDHDRVCEVQQLNGGKMDQFVTGASGGETCDGKQTAACAAAANFAIANGAQTSDPLHYYFDLAGKSALADRYFQPVTGGSAANDQYFAGAHWRFNDNDHIPAVAAGRRTSGGLCVDLPSPLNCIANDPIQYPNQTIAGLLLDNAQTFAVYADGYGDSVDAAKTGSCPSNPPTCRYASCSSHPVACFGCVYDPSDIPFLYYTRFGDSVAGSSFTPTPYVKDYEAAFNADLIGHTLPAFSFVKARVWHNEHPNLSNLTDGEAFVDQALSAIALSDYASTTLVLLTWDEGGGFFDHVAPPAAHPKEIDADDSGTPVPYGTRVPLLAIGPFAKANAISHVTLEHSSIVKFLEWNFLTQTGQLKARDGVVANLGSLLDQTKTGIPVPEN